LRAAAPARLAKDLRLAVAMGGGAPIG
jgi:hypothetical protein